MRSVVAHLLLLVASVVFAWVIWTREASERTAPAARDEDEQVAIYDIRPDALQKISFDSERRKVDITARGRADDRWFDVSTYRKDERRRPRPSATPDGGVADGGVPDGGANEPEVEVVETRKRFTGNKALTEHWTKFAPLKAKRSFGRISSSTAQEFELDHPRGTIVVQTRGKTYTLEVGGTPFGSSDAYVRDKGTGRAYLVAAATVRDIEFAESRFMQRELLGIDVKDITKVVIAAGDRRKTLVQHAVDENHTSWTDEATPQTRNEMYDNWMRRVLGLRAIDYLAPDEQPHAEEGSAETATVFTIEAFDAQGSRGRAEVRKVQSDPVEYFGRSPATRSWVSLSASLLEQIERDLDPLLH